MIIRKKLFILIFILILPSCSNIMDTTIDLKQPLIDKRTDQIDQAEQRNNSIIEQAIDENLILFNTLNDIKISNKDTILSSSQIPPNLLFFDSEKLFYEEVDDDRVYEKPGMYKINLNNGEKKYINKRQSIAYGSGEYINIGIDKYITTGTIDHNNIQQDNLILYDTIKGSEEIIYTWEHNIPISRISLIDNDDNHNIILYYGEETEEEIIYYYDIFNIKDRKKQTILTKTYNKKTKTGDSPFGTIAIQNKNIYIYSISYIQNELNHIIEQYDLNGVLQKSYTLNLDKFLKLENYWANNVDDFVRDIYKYDDIIIILTAHHRIFVCQEQENMTLKHINTPKELLIPLNQLSTEENAIQKGYMFFVTEEGELYIFNIKNKAFYKRKFNYTDDLKNFNPLSIIVNGNGDIILTSTNIMKVTYNTEVMFYIHYLKFDEII